MASGVVQVRLLEWCVGQVSILDNASTRESYVGSGWRMNASLGRTTSIRLSFGHGLDKVPLAANRNGEVPTGGQPALT